MNKWVFILVVILMGLAGLIGYDIGKGKPNPNPVVSSDTIIVTDTVTIDKPYPVYKEVIRNHYEYIPVTDTLTINDTVYVAVQRERVIYQDSLYRAVISGIHPSLDTISVYPQTTIITIKEKAKADKWHLGLQGGIGYAGKFNPYVGFGITYSFYSW
jgi:hypothetical protein